MERRRDRSKFTRPAPSWRLLKLDLAQGLLLLLEAVAGSRFLGSPILTRLPRRADPWGLFGPLPAGGRCLGLWLRSQQAPPVGSCSLTPVLESGHGLELFSGLSLTGAGWWVSQPSWGVEFWASIHCSLYLGEGASPSQSAWGVCEILGSLGFWGPGLKVWGCALSRLVQVLQI